MKIPQMVGSCLETFWRDFAEYSNIAVTKTGEADGDEADHMEEYRLSLQQMEQPLTLDEITVDTDGTHANGVFSYSEGTTVNISRFLYLYEE